MNDIVTTSTADIEAYSGDHAIPGIRFRPAREALGVTSWGMNIIELDPGCEGYPEHDHTSDGQEEVYFVLSGAAVLLVGDTEMPLTQGAVVRVPPDRKRKFITRESSATLLAIGNTPGKAYEPPSWAQG